MKSLTSFFLLPLLLLIVSSSLRAQDIKPIRGENGMWGFVNSLGKEIIPLKYDYASSFRNGLSEVVLKGRFGLVTDKGKEIIAPKYNFIGTFSEGLVDVVLNGKKGYVDSTGIEIVPPKYDGATRFSEGMAEISLNNKYGFINKKGEEIIAPRYDFSSNFNEGLAAVKLNNKWGFIDKSGKEVIAFTYDRVANFVKGEAWVEVDGTKGLIDKTGKPITKFEVKAIEKPLPVYMSAEQKKEALCKERWGTAEFNKGITRKWVTGYIILESYNCGTDQYRFYRPKQPGADPYPSSVNIYSVVGGQEFRKTSTKPLQQYVTCASCNGKGHYTYVDSETKVKELPWGYFSGVEIKKYTTTQSLKSASCQTCKGHGIVFK